MGLLIKIITTKWCGDLSQAIDMVEGMVKEYEQHSNKTLDDDLKAGLATVNFDDDEVQKHLVRNAHRLDTWDKVNDERLEFTRTTQYNGWWHVMPCSTK